MENTEQAGDFLEPVSPERGSLPAVEIYLDAEQEDDECPADEDEDVQSEGNVGDEDDEDEVGEEVTDEEGEGKELQYCEGE